MIEGLEQPLNTVEYSNPPVSFIGRLREAITGRRRKLERIAHRVNFLRSGEFSMSGAKVIVADIDDGREVVMTKWDAGYDESGSLAITKLAEARLFVGTTPDTINADYTELSSNSDEVLVGGNYPPTNDSPRLSVRRVAGLVQQIEKIVQ